MERKGFVDVTCCGWSKTTQPRILSLSHPLFIALILRSAHFHTFSLPSICASLKSVTDFESELNRRLASLREQNLFRELRRVDSPQSPRIKIGGQTFLNFSSNDYLGLANHPLLKEAAIKAVEEFGVGSGASRLVCGSLAPHHELEEALAEFKKTQAALVFSTGYAAALGTICSLVGKEDIVVLDKLIHASMIDAARLSRAKIRVFAHNDLGELESILQWAAGTVQSSTVKVQSSPAPRVLILTEAAFSMDGDCAPLQEIVELKEKYGAWLMVDEAHTTGICGTQGRGLAESFGLSDRVEVQMGTLGKALGASGGYICGSRCLVDYLVNRARSFIFSTAPIPAAAAAATAAVRLVQSKEGDARREALWQRVRSVAPICDRREQPNGSAILPIRIGDEAAALEAAKVLREQNIFVPAIRYPTVARGEARLRVTLTAAHTSEDVQKLVTALARLPQTQTQPTG